MAGSDMAGQDRVARRETNNRNTSKARGTATRTPRKAGASRGFASNPTKGGGINRPLKSSRSN